MSTWRDIIDKYYESGSELREILIRHSMQVAKMAQEIASAKVLDLAPEDIETAAMLHDVGIALTNAPGIQCHGEAPYLLHGILGGQLLRVEGMPEWVARIAERHTGSGLTAAEILAQAGDYWSRIDLSHDYMPETLLEQLICYADKFYSKSGDMQRKSLDHVRRSLAKFGPDSLSRFEALHSRFSIPVL